MVQQNKTLYLWDLAGTLFLEKWNVKKTNFKSYKDWLKHYLNKKISDISAHEYEWGYQIPYSQGWLYNLKLSAYYKKTLSWTKNNEIFSTGNREQLDWRAKYLNPRVGFDIRKFFQKFNSTFDYGETNVKTTAMMIDYLKHKYFEGYQTIVYTDDNLNNLKNFQVAAKILRHKCPNNKWRLYHILNKKRLIINKKNYCQIGNLLDLLQNEKNKKIV